MPRPEDNPVRRFDCNIMAWVGGFVVLALLFFAAYTFSQETILASYQARVAATPPVATDGQSR